MLGELFALGIGEIINAMALCSEQVTVGDDDP
jgi:hypothetical protein